MADANSPARRMQLLSRVEAAREARQRTVLRDAEVALTQAGQRAAAAASDAVGATERRRAGLRSSYSGMMGLHPAREVQRLRDCELTLAEQQTRALADSQAAAEAEHQARAVCDEERDRLRLVSLRAMRRGRLADTLRRSEALAAMTAEEDAVADDLMDRLGAATGA